MMMTRIGAAVIACALALSVSAAEATDVSCDVRCGLQESSYSPATRGDVKHRRHVDGTIIGSRPPGCPWRFCGCEASLYKFGRIIPELNLAANWIRKFARTSPAPGMAAARRGHVMILLSHVSGNDWLVHDGNSGGGKTRRHVRSIRGYVIVDPGSAKVASR